MSWWVPGLGWAVLLSMSMIVFGNDVMFFMCGYRNPYMKGPKRQFFMHFFTTFLKIFGIFRGPREAALAADWITA